MDTRETITARTAFGVPTGYLGVWDADVQLKEASVFSFNAYVVTPDGVKVTGHLKRTIHTGDLTYDEDFADLGGITFDQE